MHPPNNIQSSSVFQFCPFLLHDGLFCTVYDGDGADETNCPSLCRAHIHGGSREEFQISGCPNGFSHSQTHGIVLHITEVQQQGEG